MGIYGRALAGRSVLCGGAGSDGEVGELTGRSPAAMKRSGIAVQCSVLLAFDYSGYSIFSHGSVGGIPSKPRFPCTVKLVHV